MIKFQKVNCVEGVKEKETSNSPHYSFLQTSKPIFLNKIHRICNPCVRLLFSALLHWEFIYVKLRKVVL